MPALILAIALVAAEPSEVPLRAVKDAITVTPGATCLERDRLAAVVESTLRTSEVDARIEVQVEGDADDPLKVAYTVQRRGDVIALRRFEPGPEDCAQLHAVVGVSVALAIDATAVPDLQPDPEPPEPKSVVQPAEKVVPARDDERAPRIDAEPRRTAPPRSPWSFRLALGGGFAMNSPPRYGGYGDISLEGGWRDFVDLRASILAASAVPRTTAAGRTTLSATGGRLDLCGGYRWRMLRPRGCVGVIAGAAFGTGQGFRDDRTSRVPWLAAAFGADLRIRIARRVELELGADGVAHAVRPAFDFIDENGARRAVQEFPRMGLLVGTALVLTLTN
jgi:hypothetical protein